MEAATRVIEAVNPTASFVTRCLNALKSTTAELWNERSSSSRMMVSWTCSLRASTQRMRLWCLHLRGAGNRSGIQLSIRWAFLRKGVRCCASSFHSSLRLVFFALRGFSLHSYPTLTVPSRLIPTMQMTARVLESLEDKDSTAFAAACESSWGNEPSPGSSPDKDPMTLTTTEVRTCLGRQRRCCRRMIISMCRAFWNGPRFASLFELYVVTTLNISWCCAMNSSSLLSRRRLNRDPPAVLVFYLPLH